MPFCVKGAEIEAVFGCTPAEGQDNAAFLAPLFGEDKAHAVVKSSGFTVRRAAKPGANVLDLALPAARAALAGTDPASISGIVFVTFSSDMRYPSCAQRAAAELGLPRDCAALDVQLACGGYPYGLYVASRLAVDTGKRVLLLDGDVQTAFVSPTDPATSAVMGDGASATLLAPGGTDEWRFSFLTDGAKGASLNCPAGGPVSMQGYEVFQYVMGEVAPFVKRFAAECGCRGEAKFVPHQANLYMIRQLAATAGFQPGSLLVSGDRFGNPGSASVPMTLANEAEGSSGRYLLAGFGAGLSAAAAFISIGPKCRRGIVEV